MKPIMLHGHERAITGIKYNMEGDLIFTASKDKVPNVWYSINGERLGTFHGHQGTIWSLDVDWQSTMLITGSADMSIRLWDVSNGKSICKMDTSTSCKGVAFNYEGNQVAYTTDMMMKKDSELAIMDTRISPEENSASSLRVKVTPMSEKAISVAWGRLDRTLITTHGDGTVSKWDVRNGLELLEQKKEHNGEIKDLQMNADGTWFITSSKDTTAKAWHYDTFSVLTTFKTDRPVNAAAIHPHATHADEKMPAVVLGGGQEAMEVTTSDTRTGKFEARFFHFIYAEEFARVKGHFGPINCLAFHPNGRGYASGAEDGFIRLHTFDETYYQFTLDD